MKLTELCEGDEITYIGGAALRCCTQNRVYKVIRHPKYGLMITCDETEHMLSDANLAFFERFIQTKGGWIGVDLDGTLCVYDGWKGPYVLGAPIPKMVERVKAWLREGRDVRIFTARMTDRPTNADGTPHDLVVMRQYINHWSRKYIGRELPITNIKDWDMMELWDDRAVQVRPNTGITLADELEAVKLAEAKPKYPEGV